MIPKLERDSRPHLYVAAGCPFCHRVLAALALTGLTGKVGFTWVNNVIGPDGWEIPAGEEPLYGETLMRGLYERLEPGVEQAAAVPLLVDRSGISLLSSSSSAITRFFSRGMNGAWAVDRELCPAGLVEEVDSLNAWLHEHVNRAVYDVGLAADQADYENKVTRLFESLDTLESRLVGQPYLAGSALTESDLYLFATLVRFDSVYHSLFKCSYRRIADYPAISAYLESLNAIDRLAGSYDRARIKEHYFLSVMRVRGEVRELNPSRIIPVDPAPESDTR